MKYLSLFFFSLLGSTLATSSATPSSQPSPTYILGSSRFFYLSGDKDNGFSTKQKDPAVAKAWLTASLEGCLNQTLSNGVWKVKAHQLIKSYPITGDTNFPGWSVTLEITNQSTTTIMLADGGFSDTGFDIQIAFADAKVLRSESYDVQNLTFASLPKNGSISHVVDFLYPYPTPKDLDLSKPPTELLIGNSSSKISAKLKSKGVKFNTNLPGFKIDLTCSK
jgi:hypothetical protein